MSFRPGRRLQGARCGTEHYRGERSDATQKITPFLWFDKEAEEAASFYTSVFPSSRIVEIARYGSAGPGPAGAVMTVSFELDGQRFTALNGGPEFTFNEAISFQVDCETQDEVDTFGSTLSEGGEEGPCGWLKDRFGVSWQIVPRALPKLLADPDRERSQRVMQAMQSSRTGVGLPSVPCRRHTSWSCARPPRFRPHRRWPGWTPRPKASRARRRPGG